MEFTELPFNLPGRLFRSAMPFGRYDLEAVIFSQYLTYRVKTVVLLASDEECLQKAGRDLRQFYLLNGLQVIYLPVVDFDAPLVSELRPVVEQAYARLRTGENLAVHCNAGVGRTGVFLACLARQVFNFSADEAIQWVREKIPHAVEMPSQEQVVHDFSA